MGEVSNSTTLVALFFIVIMFCSHQVSSASCIKQERESLLRLKASFFDSSNRLASWKGTDCCSWDGVGCNNTNGHVVKLDLRNYEYFFFPSSALVSNRVDSSLFELKYLNYLDLSGNSFNNTQVPTYFSSLLELRYLNLSLTYLHGGILRSFGNLTKLLVLDFNYYRTLHGSDYFQWTKLFIDDFEWLFSLSSLEYLDLSDVIVLQNNLDLMQLLNTFPSLLSLKLKWCYLQNNRHKYAPLNSSFHSELQHLDLSVNKLDGPIPNILENMTSLKFLDLSYNSFNSSIPLWLGNFENLVVLDLSVNWFTSFEGGLYSIIRNNCHLKFFYLFYNNFIHGNIFESHENSSLGYSDMEILNLENIKLGNCTIPSWLGELKNLRELYLGNNLLYGPIPPSCGNLSSLEFLDISYNMLDGGFPMSFGKLSNLMHLNLRENNLDGVIPESFGQLLNLKFLDVSRNALKGVLSEIHFVNLSQLEYIHMTENSFLSFEMKHSWIPPFQLNFLSMGSTLGFGTTEFPRWIETQKKMVFLNLSNTNIVGPIPTWLRFQNLVFLHISYNQITGSLPKSIDDQMPNLIGLFISNAHINGSLPISLQRLKNLNLLVLSNNRLSGIIPSCLSTLNLKLLDLSSNKFVGIFPNSFQNLSNLEVMNLARNQLEGEPLMAMRNAKSLSVLDLEGNQFCGNIPAWVGKRLTNLQILNLRGNMFNGTIPSTLWLLARLQILILANNKLVGNIPPNVGNFSASKTPITEDNLVCNSAEVMHAFCYGSYIPQVMKSSYFNYSYLQLYSMVNIDLSNNNLHGQIPSEIATIDGLFDLNLSHNYLSGTIPVEIGKSVKLESLDLSFNQLSGSIPSSMSSLHSLGMLKLSNNNLSGRIPREGHLSIFKDASSYEGNPYLCGDPLPDICPNDNLIETYKFHDNDGSKFHDNDGHRFYDNDGHEEDKFEKMWFCIIVMLGYALGFWGVVGVLILKGSWRHAYFQFMDEMKDKIHVAMLINMRKLKQRMRGNNNDIHQ